MKFTKSNSVQGEWMNGKSIEEGAQVKIVSEAQEVPSRFSDREGKMDTNAKIRIKGKPDAYNVRLNRATIDGLIDAFGPESREWQGHVLTAHTEKVVVGGKRVVALYLVPEGFEVRENDEGYVEIKSIVEKSTSPTSYPEENINPEDIPF